MTSQTLRDALDSLAAAAERSGLDASAARAEGEALAAAVAEPAVGAFGAWARELGRTPNAQDFFAAAARGRRWRVTPTPLLTQLANTQATAAADYAASLAAVCTAATSLGDPNQQVVAAAMGASAAQLGAVAQPAPGSAGVLPTRPGTPAARSASGGGGAGLEPALAEKLQSSEDRRKAMDEFTAAGPGILGGVLDQLRANAERLEALRNGNLIQPAGVTPNAPAPGQPGAPTDGTTGAQEPAPTAVQEDPNAPKPEEKPKEPEKSLDELLAELDDLVGLQTVKAEIHRQTAVLKVGAMREKAGLKNATLTRHLVFVGNPGTGKTTVARLVGGIYKALGLLSKGQLIEVDRSELVAGYLGQTALKTAEVCTSAIGGVLFIDEAYSLSGDQYGEEAINTLVKEMEDNRADLVVIVAGYPLPMAKFIAENPGLASRFRTTINFDDYTDDELIGIFTGMVDKADYSLGAGAIDAFKQLLAAQVRDMTFGNGRFARNVMEAAIGRQAWRLREATDPSVDELRTLTADDILGDEAVAPVEFGVDEQPDAVAGDAGTPDDARARAAASSLGGGFTPTTPRTSSDVPADVPADASEQAEDEPTASEEDQ